MKRKNLIVPAIYLFAVLMVIGSVYLTVMAVEKYFNESENFEYGLDVIEENDNSYETIKEVNAPQVVEENSKIQIIKPYNKDNVQIARNYYDYKADNKSQEKSIIFFEDTYMQNTGVDYISEEEFDVLSVLPGKVINISEDENLGKVIKIEHDKDIISVYEGVENITVNENDQVESGFVIAKSGESSINANYKEAMHFEVYYKGEIINPEDFYKMDFETIE